MLLKKVQKFDLKIANYAVRVSSYIDAIISKKYTGNEFSEAMELLLKTAERIYNETKEIENGYEQISKDLQMIYSECDLRCDRLIQKKEAKIRAIKKEKRESRHEAATMVASVLGGVSVIVFPPAAAFFGGIAAIETYKAKRSGKKVLEAKAEGSNFQNSLESIECFQRVIEAILEVVKKFEDFWKQQVVKVGGLVDRTKDYNDYVSIPKIEAEIIVKEWKEVESRFIAYNSKISNDLKYYSMKSY
jgi:hypothetical protein